jgi:hypothetical protein
MLKKGKSKGDKVRPEIWEIWTNVNGMLVKRRGHKFGKSGVEWTTGFMGC